MPSLPSQSSDEPPSLLRTLGVVFSGVLFGLFLSKLQTPVSDSHSSDETQNNPTYKRRDRDEFTDVSFRTRLPPVEPPQASPHHYDANDERRDRYNRGIFWLQLLTLIALVVYATFTYGLLCETRKSVQQADNNFRVDQRAWVTISDIPVDSKKDSDWTVPLVFKNTGRTPAKNFTIKVVGEPVAKGRKTTLEEHILPGHGVIAPEGTFHSNLNVSGSYDWNTVDLVIHGRVNYDSIFKQVHWTNFCYYFVPDNRTGKGGFAPCETGNDTDNNPP